MHILWINEVATMTGGCEHYIVETVGFLRRLGFRSTLLYSVDGDTDPAFTGVFDGAFPMVDVAAQVASLAPDVLYVHRLSDLAILQSLVQSGIPVTRFFHDHKLFCLREHKYTAIGRQTCTRPIGTNCYTCLGFVQKTSHFPGIGLRTVGALQREQQANRSFDAFVVASHYMRDQIVAHGFDPARISVNPLYAMPTEVAEAPCRDENLLLFAGQLTTGKGLDTLLHALAHTFTSPRLIISGTGKFETEYRLLCAKLNLDSRVTFAGRLSQAELSALYQRAACVVVPSRAPETFGLIGPEAMRYGTPLIATTVGGMNEWLQPGKTGLAVPPNDAHALAQAIDLILTDSPLRRRMGEAAKAVYEADFRPERHIERLTQLFASLHAKGYCN